MTENFSCPRHGEYPPGEPKWNLDRKTLESTPTGDRLPATCPLCRDAATAAKQQAQQGYAAAVLRWRRWEAAEIPHRYRNRTLANWRAGREQEAAGQVIRSWAQDVRGSYDAGDGLLLMGPPGVGKTHLLSGLVAAVIAAGFKARYASWPEAWASCRPPFTGNPEQLFRALMSVDFLALDEIGIRAGTTKEQERLFELIDYRYSHALPTLVATNLTAADLVRIGERTADRLREACTGVVLTGASKRQEAAEDASLRGAPEPYHEPERPLLTLLLSVDGQEREEQWEAKQVA